MNETRQSRWKSWALWTSVAALAAFCLKEFCGIDVGDKLDGLLNVLLPALTAFGIVNDPTRQNAL